MEPKTYSVKEAAALLGISERHAYSMCAIGRIPAIRLGQRYVIPRRALDELLGERPPAAV